MPLSQSSNWSTQSDAASQVDKHDKEAKRENIVKIKQTFIELGQPFPLGLDEGLDIIVRIGFIFLFTEFLFLY